MRLLAISGQHVAALAAMIYVVLRLFAVPMPFRKPAKLGLVWLYIFVPGAPPSATRRGRHDLSARGLLFGGHIPRLNCTS